MIKTTGMLLDELSAYSDPRGKIMRMVRDGQLFMVKRGLYETDKNTPGHCLAPSIYGPSYLSFEYALAYYDMIPEAVYVYTNASLEKRKTKVYENYFGRYTYRDIPRSAYPYCVRYREENGYGYFLASPEKALCDRLFIASPVHSVKDIREMIFDDLRIDEDEYANLNKENLFKLCDKYRSNNLKCLKRMIAREEDG